MGNRLSKIYTKTGDMGSTGLGDGSRTLKCGERIEVIGTVDELNCVIGTLLCETLPQEISETLTEIQHELFDLGSELSVPGYSALTEAHIDKLEHHLDTLNSDLGPLKEFILPGGSRGAAICHQARAVCRRAERRLIQLEQKESTSAVAKKYLNRLSDYLFVACRTINKNDGVSDLYWANKKTSKIE